MRRFPRGQRGGPSGRSEPWLAVFAAALAIGCGTSPAGAPGVDAGGDLGGDAGGDTDRGEGDDDGGASYGDDGGGSADGAASGGDATARGTYPAARFATRLVSYRDGGCGGYGQSKLPDVVLGPPVGGGAGEGSLDVVSLGTRGAIVLAFDDVIVDGPGADFLVFENPFLTSGQPDFELAQVSVSDDGVAWTSFPCTATGPAPSGSGYGTCAGWHPVYSTPSNGISPLDPAVAGGDPFDLSVIGVPSARFVKIEDVGVDYTAEPCVAGSTVETNGFDLDAVSIVNAAPP